MILWHFYLNPTKSRGSWISYKVPDVNVLEKMTVVMKFDHIKIHHHAVIMPHMMSQADDIYTTDRRK